MINKTLIKERFKKSLNTYEENSIVQHQMAENLVQMVAPIKKFNSILELGCGSGVLTKKIINKFEFDSYDAVDIVKDCEMYVKEISNDINFIDCDIEEFSTNQKYNLIISNATVQWVEKLPQFLEKIYSMLEDNGMLIFSTFGENNFKEIKQITGEGLCYYSIEELKDILQLYAPFSLKEENTQINFATPIDVIKHLKLTGVNSLTQAQWTKADLKKFETEYKKLSEKIKLTYHPIYIAIIKI